MKAEEAGGPVDPARRPFEFEEDAHGGLIEHCDAGVGHGGGGQAGASRQDILGAVFLVAESRTVAQRLQDLNQARAAAPLQLELYLLANLVFAALGRPFEGHQAVGAADAEPEDEPALAQRLSRRVKEDISLKNPPFFHPETGLAEQAPALRGAPKSQLDLDFLFRGRGACVLWHVRCIITIGREVNKCSRHSLWSFTVDI